MTNLETNPNPATSTERLAQPPRSRWYRPLAAGIVVLVVVAVLAAILAPTDRNGIDRQTADVGGQGGDPPLLADNATTLTRRDDGLVVEIELPVPSPGTYEYPTGDMVPPWADPHPTVSPGASGAPEVFTVWLIAFNDPTACTNPACDADDLDIEAAARGGTYQVDGRVAADDMLMFAGAVRLGQEPETGSPLDNPIGAEVHVAIAPHGRALAGPDGWRQLNGPVGNPAFWWTSTFIPPGALPPDG